MSERETISALRIDLYDCTEPPAKIVRREMPSNAVRRAWIPQTVGDQVWLLYEFANVEDRLAWESGLSPLMSKWLDRELIKHALPFGWHVRDAMTGMIIS
jgi:hypothetical protein